MVMKCLNMVTDFNSSMQMVEVYEYGYIYNN